MLRKLHDKLSSREDYLTRTFISHCDCVSALSGRESSNDQSGNGDFTGVADETYDACVMMNVLFALDEPVECLKEIRRVLKYDGILSLSTSDETTDVERLFRQIQSSLEQKGEWERKKELFERARARNREMVPLSDATRKCRLCHSWKKRASRKSKSWTAARRGVRVPRDSAETQKDVSRAG